MDLDEFYSRCAKVADHIDSCRDEIHQLLSRYQTWEVIDHEIEFSIEALKNVRTEYKDVAQPKEKVVASCFMPVNMPLYSLILYAVLPSLYYKKIYIRPGVSLSNFIYNLQKLLQLDSFGFDQIAVKDLPAKLFIDLYAKDSDVILFTGKYENAQVLEKECPESLLIFEGTGPCPFFIFKDADTKLAAKKAVSMRCFNSGQDCVAPDVFFVHKTKLPDFTRYLVDELSKVKVGNSKDREVKVAHTIKEKYLYSIQEWLEQNRQNIIFGGEIDTKRLIVYPTVLVKDLNDHKGGFKELFSPVFYITHYQDDNSLLEKINSSYFKERSMYACIFGHNKSITDSLSLCTLLFNETVNDQENGNAEYGGFGPKANFISYKGIRDTKPLLISRDIRNWLLAKKSNKLPEKTLQVA